MYKYEIPATCATEFTVMLPKSAKIRRVGWQNNQMFMWCEISINNTNPSSSRKFKCFGTGQHIPVNYEYVATWEHGPLIIHLFEIP